MQEELEEKKYEEEPEADTRAAEEDDLQSMLSELGLTQEEFDQIVDDTFSEGLEEEIDALLEEEASETEGRPEEEPVEPVQPEERTFTQRDMNDLAGRTRKEAKEKALREMLEKYGVDNEEELDGVFGKGQSYDMLNDDYTSQTNAFNELKAENALLKSKTDEDRWDDIKAILRNKGMEVTVENILEMSQTHPEWMKQEAPEAKKSITLEEMSKIGQEKPAPTQTEEPSVMRKFGVDIDGGKNTMSDEETRAMGLFGFKH